jgi:pilus assembly protein CpaE
VSGPARIVVVVGACGGAGTSTVAGGLALAAAGAGRPAWLVELDLDRGDLAGAWELVGERTIAELSAVAGEIAPGHVRNAVRTHASGVEVLLAPPAGSSGARWLPEGMAPLLEAVASACGPEGRVVVDVGSGATALASAAARHAAEVLVVGPASLAGARRARRVVAATSGRVPPRLVVVDRPGRADLGARGMARVVAAPLAGALPWSARRAAELTGGRWPRGRRGLGPAVAALSEGLG